MDAAKDHSLDNRKTRIIFIDIAKCIAMIAVIMGHTQFQRPEKLERLIYAFHMPLFFMASGYFFHQAGLNKAYIKKLAKSLILPYWLVSAGIIVINIIIDAVNNNPIQDNVIKWASAALYGSGSRTDWSVWFSTEIVIIGLLWFFLALFWGKIILASIFKLSDKSAVRAILVCGIAWSGYYMSQHGEWFPLSFYAGMTSVFFIWIGYLFRKYDVIHKKCPAVLLLLGVFLCIYVAFRIEPLYLSRNKFDDGFMNVIAAIVISYLILKMCYFAEFRKIIGIRAISFLGKNTLLLAAVHQLEAKFINWGTDIPRLLTDIGLPSNYWVVSLTRCLFVICVFLLMKGIFASFQKMRTGKVFHKHPT